ncbi:pollen receptor-like kinase 4 [Salvia miltiorrhiza]|uniref:pollen receptor-like kinase 4 n=1 Tax=Salvia miltiorrhiza TaxID=226208 RepID=UPI0025AB6C00|nr:pollen receptor-like kinase 4 [Salvia miltiorrhiza]
MAPTTHSWFLILFMLSVCALPSSSDDRASLLSFAGYLTNAQTLLQNWTNSVALCSGNTSSWTGVLCKQGTFNGLKLDNMGLGGKIDVDSLSALPLFSLSLFNNSFSGPFPSDIKKLGKLRRLFLSNNNFSGEIPDKAFIGMNPLKQVDLANNAFVGKIPTSLMRMSSLLNLTVQNNQFVGKIPDFWQENLTANFANNRLHGSIPDVLSHEDASMFFGNLGLCGPPLAPCPKKWYKKPAFIAAASAAAAAVVIIFILILIWCRRRSRPMKSQKSVNLGEAKTEKAVATDEKGKLQFVRSGRDRFELEDLLKASAEVLGSGSFGSSYKAVLLTGHPHVVRRFKHMSNVGKEDFHRHMSKLGRLSHPNLLPLVAFYYKKDEKLLISDFVSNGSLASHLHGKRRPGQPGLDWPTRLRVIKGVARGLTHLYQEFPALALPHGHLKSSNVLLDDAFEAVVSDYALAPVMNREHAQQFMVAYKSPEAMGVTRKTDVWGLGILILEVLTGRFPADYLKSGRGASADLATWVNSVVREEWTGEVFDKEMSMARNCEGQMLRLLKIGMCCCEWDVGKRWEMKEAAERIEELKERESDDDYSSYASEGDGYSSSRAMTDEDFSFSRAG